MNAAINAALLGLGVSFLISGHEFRKPWLIIVGGALLGAFAGRVS